jgi:hypothetical protein
MTKLLSSRKPTGDVEDDRVVRDRPTASTAGSGNRRPWYIGSGVLLTAFAALLGALALGAQGEQRALVVASRPIPAGVTLTRDMLRVERIPADVKLVGVPSNKLGGLVGLVTNTPIAANSLVLVDSLASAQQPPVGFTVVAMVLEPGEAPSELRYGDRVHVLATPLDRTGETPAGLVAIGSVWSISGGGSSQTAQSVGTGRRILNLVVRTTEESIVAQGAARHAIRLGLVDGGPIWTESPEAADPNTVIAAETPTAEKPTETPVTEGQ